MLMMLVSLLAKSVQSEGRAAMNSLGSSREIGGGFPKGIPADADDTG